MSIIKHQTVGSRIFDVFNYTIMGIIAVVMVFPLFFVVIGSFSISGMIGGFNAFSLDAYKYIFTTNSLARSTVNSVFITVVGTFINIVMTSITAYALSKKYLAGRNVMMTIIVIFMLFNPGMIPNYLVVSKLHMTNSFLSLWLPGAISAYNMIIMKNFFQGLPDSIEESAKIDGCHDLQVFLKIVLPISKASLATITLFYAVGHWNSWFNAMIYFKNSSSYPLQTILRSIVIENQMSEEIQMDEIANPVSAEGIKYSTLVISMVPMMVVYPFIQKYFVKGVMIGSIKG